jgi:uncharacterized protein YqeY
MSDTPSSLRTRLSHDLRRAMKERDKVATMTLRSLLEALDNAAAVPLTSEHTPVIGRSADVPRKAVTEQEYERIVRQEAASLNAAALEFEQIGRSEAAAGVRAELRVVLRYINP